MKIAVGSDHAGYDLKEFVKAFLSDRGISVEDAGCLGRDSVDYPDYAMQVVSRVLEGRVEQGILICATGIGMSMTANRYPGIRAALCMTPEMAEAARSHNNANILVLAGRLLSRDQTAGILNAWLGRGFSGESRHVRRLAKMENAGCLVSDTDELRRRDHEVADAVMAEQRHLQTTINLIASENYASRAVRQAQGSVMTNKYAEGYPGKRWYNGCENVDTVERLAIDRALRLFGAQHANVQPHCGSSANMAVYFSILNPGDTILAMSLAHGGHLTHGHNVNFSGRFFRIVSYGVDRKTETIDYGAVAALAEQHKPKLIVAGASAYPRVIDFAKFREIADRNGAHLMVDMAHIAGLVAGGAHPSPVPVAEFVTSTTHKTLRGPRSGMILCREAFAAQVDRQVFPGLQGGPLMHVIAAKAVCFGEALDPSFREYAAQVVRNAAVLAEALLGGGLRLVSGGTDNHMMLVDLSPLGMTGRDAAAALDRAGIIVNKNAIPFDTQSPFLTSGIRIGTPAVTTRGMREPEMKRIASIILDVLRSPDDEKRLNWNRMRTRELADSFPVP